MGDGLQQQLQTCRRCRYRFSIPVQTGEVLPIEVQCPCCEAWISSTLEDAQDPPKPDPQELRAAAQRIGKLLWQPINEHRAHPAVAWIDCVGNGVFHDDWSEISWPAPWTVYRFTRGPNAAYMWQEGDSWFVRGWYRLRGRRKPPEPVEVISFETALDRLVP
jgi:hypothetical protein